MGALPLPTGSVGFLESGPLVGVVAEPDDAVELDVLDLISALSAVFSLPIVSVDDPPELPPQPATRIAAPSAARAVRARARVGEWLL